MWTNKRSKNSDKLIIVKKFEFIAANLIQKYFGDIKKSILAGVSLAELAKKIKNSDKVRDNKDLIKFRTYSLETISKMMRSAAKGCEFEGQQLSGFFNNDFYDANLAIAKTTGSLNSLIESNGDDIWTDCEKDFLVENYKKGLTPKAILELYSQNNSFSPRELNGVNSQIIKLRGELGIGTQRVFWDGEVGDWAKYLLSRYGRNKGYCDENANFLNGECFSGEDKLDGKKVAGFYARNDLNSLDITDTVIELPKKKSEFKKSLYLSDVKFMGEDFPLVHVGLFYTCRRSVVLSRENSQVVGTYREALSYLSRKYPDLESKLNFNTFRQIAINAKTSDSYPKSYSRMLKIIYSK